MSYQDVIKQYLSYTIDQSNLPFGTKKQCKIRDLYIDDDRLLLLTTDRQSAFDRVLATIPFKGRVLNMITAWWFEQTEHIIPNHFISMPHPNITIAERVEPIRLEVIVRGYITGSTKTSLWTQYNNGVRFYCGQSLPEGLKKNDALVEPMITPTTKGDSDELISAHQIVKQGILTEEEWQYISEKALELFAFGQKTALKNGLILVDTKYEFGRRKDGTILLIDEVHTPDSSRYWIASTYASRVAMGQEPENIDKEFLRLWFTQQCDPYTTAVLPDAPDELVVELSNRYIRLYEMITGRKFYFPSAKKDPLSDVTTSIDSLRLHSTFVDTINDSHMSSNKKNFGFMCWKNLDLDPERDHAQSSSSSVVVPQATEERMFKRDMTQPFTDRQQQASQKKDFGRVVIIAASAKDSFHTDQIISALKELDVAYDTYVASAHKDTHKLLDILMRYNGVPGIVFVTCAGLSNALSGVVAANIDAPVIACPVFSDKADMLLNIQSSLQMPSNIPVLTVLNPRNAALAASRVLRLYRSDERQLGLL